MLINILLNFAFCGHDRHLLRLFEDLKYINIEMVFKFLSLLECGKRRKKSF